MHQIAKMNLHRDPGCFRVNELAPRAYFIPFESEEQTRQRREHSAYYFSLNGEWRFSYRPSLYEMEDFYLQDFDCTSFATVTVPENWQMHGADCAQYQTSPYPFIFDPPFVPEKNPCAAYIKDFELTPKAGKRYELHFEGKDSCVYVWMNGSFIGYGECPHCDSVFDVTASLRAGQNRLCVLVLKWCSGSYLDDQDKIRLSGLFRDVYILERSEGGLTDIAFTAGMDGIVRLDVTADLPVQVKLEKEGQVLCEARDVDRSTALKVDSPVLWSSEAPELYDLMLHCADEYVRIRFGFRDVRVENGIFTVNQRAVKLYGINRHDFSPDTGYAVDYDFIRQELLMMKRYNINAIRTSHYPNSPFFYELCNELGFYVLSEADMECHGCVYMKEWERIVDDPLYAPAIHDRSLRMYHALKNLSCICIWSLGNESHWGENLKQEAIYFKETDPTRPLHYEGWSGVKEPTPQDLEFWRSYFDFYSRMYPQLDTIEEQLSNGAEGFSYLMCEYSHAMGNSCGDLRFYDEMIQREPRFAGGFIWEWCDQAIRMQDEEGKEYWGYGGDFGERHHGRNICMDGVVTPDRQPHSALLEAKAVYAPVRVEKNADGGFTFFNRHAFTDLKEYDTVWSILQSGKKIFEQRNVISCAPGACVTVPSPKLCLDGENAVLYVHILTRTPTQWAEPGHGVAAFSFRLKGAKPAVTDPTLPIPEVTESCSAYEVRGKGFSYTFRKDEGVLGEMVIGGKNLLAAPMEWNCFRAPTDNDDSMMEKCNVYRHWAKTSLFGCIAYPEIAVRNFTCNKEDTCVCLSGDFLFAVQGRAAISRGQIEYRIFGDGRISVHQHSRISDALSYWLPRYGYTFAFAEPLKDITYFGYGPAECYEDKRSHALLGQYPYIPDDPCRAYEKPQESGSHLGTEWLTAKTAGVHLRISGSFSFCASRYDVHSVAAAKHRKDLILHDGTYLYLDYRMSGVGSASCGGQTPIPACRIEPGEEVDFSIELQPL